MMKHKASILAATFAVWAILVTCCIRSITVGLAFSGEETGGVGLVVLRSDGRRETPTARRTGNKVSFSLPLDARHFYFTLSHRDKPYLVKGICVLGFNVFPSDWVFSNIAPSGDVYLEKNAARKPGDPIYIN